MKYANEQQRKEINDLSKPLFSELIDLQVKNLKELQPKLEPQICTAVSTNTALMFCAEVLAFAMLAIDVEVEKFEFVDVTMASLRRMVLSRYKTLREQGLENDDG